VTAGDAAPSIEEFTVENEPVSLEVGSAGPLVLRAFATDDVGVESVDFYWDGAYLGTDDAEPFEWTVHVDTDGLNGDHQAFALAHDTAEQVSEKSDTVDVAIDVPLSSSLVWQVLDPDFASRAHAVTTDSVGDVIAVGRAAVLGDELRTQIIIRKYRASEGDELWERVVPGTMPIDGFSVAHGVAVDRHDNVYVVGDYNPDDDGGHLWIGKFAPDGLPIGKDFVHPLPFTFGHGIAIDTTGTEDRVFVDGYIENLDHDSGYIAELSLSLKPVWSDTVEDAAIANNRLYGIAIDSRGDLVFVGSYDVSVTQRRGLVLKYDSKGQQKWWRSTDAKSDTKIVGYSIVLGADDDIVGVGRLANKSFAEALWFFSFDSEGNKVDSLIDVYAVCGTDGCSVAADASGHLLVAGALPKDQGPDYLVQKVEADWGNNLWSKAVDGFDGDEDRSLGVAADAAGYVYGAGFQTKGGTTRWSVIKFNP